MRTNGSVVRLVSYPSMDGLRFYAAFLVYMVHYIASVRISILGMSATNAPTPSLLERMLTAIGDGHHGVDIFFILSGFLMGRHVFSNKEKFSYLSFLAARFKRIYPAFFVSYCFAVLSGMYFGMSWSFKDFALGLAFLNAIPALGIKAYHYVSWSIGFEFLFYVIFPAIFLFLPKLPGYVKAVVALSICLVVTLNIPALDWALRLSGLFLGLSMSFISDQKFRQVATMIPWPMWIAPYAFYLITRDSPPQLWSFLLSLISGCGLFIVVVFGTNPISRAASTTAVRFLGTISYSLYLWHTLCISLTLHIIIPVLGLNKFGAVPTAVFLAAISIPLSVLSAYISYVTTERFYFARKERLKDTRDLKPITCSSQ